MLKISDKEKILEARVMGETHYKQNKDKDVSRFSVRNSTSKRTAVSIFKVLLKKKKKVNLGFYSQGKLLSKMKANRS